MKNRRSFLTVVAGGGLSLSLAANAVTEGASGTPPTSPLPSRAALATAATFTAFDPALNVTEIETIAKRISENRSAASVLNPRSKRLQNSDDIVTRFAADESLER